MFLTVFISLAMLAQAVELNDEENRKNWGMEPNTIPNPGFENIDPTGRPLNWESGFPANNLSLSEIQNYFGFNRKIPVLNSGFEEVDESRDFLQCAKVRKIGRVKYHKNIWIAGLDFKKYKSEGKLKTDEIYPVIEEKTVHGGKKALRFEVKNSRGFSWSEIYMDKVFEVKPFTEYILSFWYYNAGSSNVYGNFWLHLGGKKYVKVPELERDARNKWLQHIFYFRTGKESGKSSLQFWATCAGPGVSGAVIFDEISVFQNEGPWDEDAWLIADEDAYDGQGCLAMAQTPWPATITGDPIGIDCAKKYRLKLWLKSEDATGENYIKVNWKNYKNSYDMQTLKTDVSSPIKGTFGWKEIEMPLAPPEKSQFLEVELYSRGNSGQWMADNLFLDGFGDQNIEFLMSQAGFEKEGYKDVVIRTKEKFANSPILEIYQAGNAENPLLRKNMEYWGKYKWGGHYYTAEFSELKKEADYFIKLKYNGKEQASPAFPVKKGLYRELARKGARYFYYQRSGYAIPGWHKAMHLDDAWVSDFGTSERYYHQELTGGWFDAADWNKWLNIQGKYLRSLANTCKKLEDKNRDFLKGKYPDFIEEAKWGADYIKKSYKDKGDFYIAVKLFDWRGPPDEDTDNIPGNDDDRVANGLGPETGGTMGLASFGEVYKKAGDKQADMYLATAEDAFKYQLESPKVIEKLKDFSSDETIFLSLAAMHLYHATGKDLYLNFAGKTAKEAAQACIAGKYMSAGEKAAEGKSLLHYLEILEEFVMNFPGEKESEACKKALGIVSDYMMKVSALSPLGHTQTLTEDIKDSGIFSSPNRSTTYLLSCAAHLAVISVILKKPELLKIAERDLQYALGRNFHGASCMAQIGWKWESHFTYLSLCPGHADGIIPYAVAKGHAMGERMFRPGMPYTVIPGPLSPDMQEWNREVYGLTQSYLLDALANIAIAREE